MTLALHPGADSQARLELGANQSWSERNRAALRDLREGAALWRLCTTLAWLDIRLRYRGSVLGPFWLTLSTAAMVGAMGLLYALLFRLELREYIPFLAMSLVLWNFLGALVTDACVGFTSAESTIRSVRMPFSLYAGRIVLRNLIVLAHNAVVVVAVDLLLWTWPGGMALYALPGLALWGVNALALTLLLGAVCARFRDIPPIVGSVMQMAFFVSAVIWRPEQLGARVWMLDFNPFFSLLDIVRAPLLGTLPAVTTVWSALGFSAALWIVAWLVFARVRGRIAFWI